MDEGRWAGPVDLAEVFGNDRPVEVEIGAGKGTFLVARAAARPEVNFLGLERARAYARYAADRCRRRKLANVRVVSVDAANVFGMCLAAEAMIRVHIYFPDPWPKRRHHRRRLIQPSFLAAVARTLRPGGQLIIITDHMDYFLWIRRVLQNAPGLARISLPRMTDESGQIAGTNFERKYIAQGRAFYATAVMRYACCLG